MNSKPTREAFVWIWLPNETTPVVAGKLEIGEIDRSSVLAFNYTDSYMQRVSEGNPVIPIYEPELPLVPGTLPLPVDFTIPGCIRDASPDAWGRRVIIYCKLGLKRTDIDTVELDELTYLLESGSDRIGALDFQLSPTEYIPREANNTELEELVESAGRLEQGESIPPELANALVHSSSIGGARPKALVQEHNNKYVAKFSSRSDYYDVVKVEYVAMRLAAIAGLNVAPVKLVKVGDKNVILVERFDRELTSAGWARKPMVSALTILGLHSMLARYASYWELAETIRFRFTDPKKTLKELFSRLVFNILCGNTDDHARNHAAFWDGRELTLTPAYDICPQGRAGNEVGQAMRITDNNNLSQLKTCIEVANYFHLSKDEAHAIFAHQIRTIEENWDSVCDEAGLSQFERSKFWQRQFLNPFSVITD